MKILITGQHGQVSQALQQRLPAWAPSTVLGRDQLDLANPADARAIRSHRPNLIINAAAHTAVDQAESEPDAAFAINAEAPGSSPRKPRPGRPADPLLHRLCLRRQQACALYETMRRTRWASMARASWPASRPSRQSAAST
jgi:hypothetical protein